MQAKVEVLPITTGRGETLQVDFAALRDLTSRRFVAVVKEDLEKHLDAKDVSDLAFDVVRWDRPEYDGIYTVIIARLGDGYASHFYEYYPDSGAIREMIINQYLFQHIIAPFML